MSGDRASTRRLRRLLLATAGGLPVNGRDFGPNCRHGVGLQRPVPTVACYTDLTMADLTATFSTMMMRWSRLPTRWVGGKLKHAR